MVNNIVDANWRPANGLKSWLQRRPISGGHLIAAELLSPSPGKQVVNLLHGPAVDKLGKNVGQIGLWVQILQFCGFNQGRQAGPIGAAIVVTCEQAVLAIEGDWPYRPLDVIGIELDTAIFQE